MDIDVLCKEYIRKNEIFADAFNYYLFDGKQIINPNNLKEMDTSLSSTIKNKIKLERYRDIYKLGEIKEDNNQTYILLGIENQSVIDPTMLIRCMIYDSLSYLKQFDNVEKDNKNGKIRLKPVITLVIYFGTKKWNVPDNLYELIDLGKKEELKKIIPNYKLNVISPYDIEDKDFNKMKSELRLILKFIKNSKNKDKLIKIIKEDIGYKKISKEAFTIINEITNTEIKIENEEGELDMCKAIDDMKKQAKEEGIIEGKLEGKYEGILEVKKESTINLYKNGVSIEIISKSLNMSLDDVKDILNKEGILIN